MLPTFQLDRRLSDPLEDWVGRFYDLLASAGTVFRKEDGSLWICTPGIQPYRIDRSLDDFQGLIHNVIRFEKAGTNGSTYFTMLERDPARLLLYAEQRNHLPILQGVVTDPAVVPDGDGFRVTPPGFDVPSGVYYHLVPPARAIEPLEGVSHLTECFSAVPFEKPEYRNNLIAWLLGALVLDSRFGDSPFLVVSGNQRGIGKSKTAESCGLILTGQAQAPIDQSGEEFEKQVGARFNEGARFIFLDNIATHGGGAYHNNRLARLITAGYSKKVRLLGHSRSIAQSGVLFVGTANDCKLDQDLASRALPVKLYKEVSSPMVPFVLDYARAHRRELYGELLALALRKPEIVVTGSLHPNFRFRRWLEFVYPRVVPIFGKLALDEAQELDDAIIELLSWAMDQKDDLQFTSHDLIEVVSNNRDRFPALVERLLKSPSERARKITTTNFLKTLAGKSLSLLQGTFFTLTVARPPEHDTPAAFAFERRIDAA